MNHELVVIMQICKKTRVAKRGFTLIETIIVLSLFAMLLGVTGFVFVVSLRAWDAGLIRGGIREDVSYAIEKVVRNLKEMANVSPTQYGSNTHTIQYDDLGGTTYVFYLYEDNANDLFDPNDDPSLLYELRKNTKAQLDAGNYSTGVLILRDLVSPAAAEPATDLTISGNEVTLDIVVQRGDETVVMRTKVRPRNL